MPTVIPFPSPTPPDDTAARSRALDTNISCIVEAPAGSGKTGLLVQRYLKLLADPATLRPEEVLAVTFTNKATAELRERILHHLHAASAPPSPTASPFDLATRDLAAAVLSRHPDWNLLTQPQRLNIHTFDAVCLSLSSALPVLSGSGGARQPVLDARPLYRLAARRTLMQLGVSAPRLCNALSTVLLHRDASLADVESLLASMLGSRDQWAELVPFELLEAPSPNPDHPDTDALDREVRPRLEQALEAVVCDGLTRALRALPPHILSALAAFAARHAELPGYKDAASPIAICANKNATPQAIAEHLDHWCALIHLLLVKEDKWRSGFNVNHLGFAPSRSEKTLLEGLVAELRDHPQSDRLLQAVCEVRCLPPARYPDEQWHVAKALFLVLRHALAELKVLFAQRSESDFIEFSLNAREALSAGLPSATGHLDADHPLQTPSDTLAAGSHLRHLLVDEMQDTSSAQYHLIQLLTHSWDGRSQTLFLVGDPKQSIYLFRQARVERFLRTMHDCQLGDITLLPLRLTSNFRSQGGLVRAFNQTFQLLFPPPDAASASDVPFVSATSVRTDTDSDAITWHTDWNLEPADQPYNPAHPAGSHRQQEARKIRSVIEAHLASSSHPPRIAVLGLNRSHLTAVVAEFKRDLGHGPLPFRGIELDPLADLPEVLDLLALTRALLHPADRTAWLAVLRAPWCGLSQADLLALTGQDTADANATLLALAASRSHLLSDTGQQLFARVSTVFSTAISTLGQTSLATSVERTWRSLGGVTYLSPDRQENALRYLALLRELELSEPPVNVTTLTARLKALYAAPLSGDHIHVDLLTIHKSKGLEWDIVIVPSLERASRVNTSELLNWQELDSEPSIILAPIWGKGSASDKLNNWLRSVQRRREAGERKRLFYVASTRAREYLHLFAEAATKSTGELATPASNSLLFAAWPAAQHRFTPTPPIALEQEPLALAASAPTPPLTFIQRLPLGHKPLHSLFLDDTIASLPTPRAALPISTFDRPDGSFSVRAFGNVVHRFLQLLADRLAVHYQPDALLKELSTWEPRLAASLRNEGLPPTLAAKDAVRALDALRKTLSDPVGAWLLAPHPFAISESAVNTASTGLRIDRSFLAGESPLSFGNSTIWIVDFKTSLQGSRTDASFESTEITKYRPQLEAYAKLRRALPDGALPIRLALYYPLLPRLIHFSSEA